MGKVLRVLVVLILLLGIAATVFAYKNYAKREALAGRAHKLEDSIVRLAATFEAEDLPDVAAPTYPSRDISEVTAREIEAPERSTFWDGYNAKLEANGVTPEMLNYGSQSKRLQLRQFYCVDAMGNYVLDPLTGTPATEGEGTMEVLLKNAYDRAKSQYSNLLDTRVALKQIREELVSTIEELNKLKQDGRKDKVEIERLNAEVAQLTSQLRAKESELEAANEKIKEQEEQIAELNDNINGLNEELAVCNDKVKELEQTIRDLKGKNPNVIQSVAALEEGVLTPGDKGKVVATSEEWKYAIVEFSPEFMAELIGPQRDRALPQSEVMARRAGVENIDDAFVTRMKLRQAIRDKNLVIVDILTDWQQKPVKVGDIVFY